MNAWGDRSPFSSGEGEGEGGGSGRPVRMPKIALALVVKQCKSGED